MMYPFLQLPDKTEIVHTELLEGERVKVYLIMPYSRYPSVSSRDRRLIYEDIVDRLNQNLKPM